MSPAKVGSAVGALALVPDEATAITMAVWTPIFGEGPIRRQHPYVATLAGGHWTVGGTLPRGMRGGTASAIIAQEDGRVLRVSHDR